MYSLEYLLQLRDADIDEIKDDTKNIKTIIANLI
jgi:hypothetical protein